MAILTQAVAQQEQRRLDDEMHKMADAYREKAKTQAHLHKVYTQLKAQVLAGQVASAASDDAEATLQSATGDQFAGPGGGHPKLPHDRNAVRLGSRNRSNETMVGGQGPSGRLFSPRTW